MIFWHMIGFFVLSDSCIKLAGYDTIQDAVLTCAQKPTQVSLTKSTVRDQKLKSGKMGKVRSKKRVWSEASVFRQSVESAESVVLTRCRLRRPGWATARLALATLLE